MIQKAFSASWRLCVFAIPYPFCHTPPMLDPKLVRENPEAVREATRIKRIASPELVDSWLKADEKRRNSQLQADTLRNEQKKISDQVGQLKRQLKGASSPEVEQLIAQSNSLKQQQQD